jgi:hypothetical protein
MEVKRGAQYRVLDVEGDRVRKIPLTREESREVIRKWYLPETPPESALAIDYTKTATECTWSIQKLLKQFPGLAPSFGNPRFEEHGIYTQDKVRMLEDEITKCSSSTAHQLIDDYAGLILLHWRYGISDYIFNFTANNGIRQDGQLALIDFGEITQDKAKVVRCIQTRRWLRAYSYLEGLPKALRPYYTQVMRTRLTDSALEKVWGSAL